MKWFKPNNESTIVDVVFLLFIIVMFNINGSKIYSVQNFGEIHPFIKSVW